MNKITKMIVSAIMKKGILCESDDIDMEIDVPASMLGLDSKNSRDQITIRIKADNVKISIEK